MLDGQKVTLASNSTLSPLCRLESLGFSTGNSRFPILLVEKRFESSLFTIVGNFLRVSTGESPWICCHTCSIGTAMLKGAKNQFLENILKTNIFKNPIQLY